MPHASLNSQQSNFKDKKLSQHLLCQESKAHSFASYLSSCKTTNRVCASGGIGMSPCVRFRLYDHNLVPNMIAIQL